MRRTQIADKLKCRITPWLIPQVPYSATSHPQEKPLDSPHYCSSVAYVCSRWKNGRTQIIEASTADHGGAVGARQGLHSRNPGNVPRKTHTSLHDRPDYRLSLGSEECGAPHQEGRQFSHF